MNNSTENGKGRLHSSVLPFILPYAYTLGNVPSRRVVGRQRRVSPCAPRKCSLPGCGETTTHNGGYCCAEHCRQHRILRGERVKYGTNSTEG